LFVIVVVGFWLLVFAGEETHFCSPTVCRFCLITGEVCVGITVCGFP
jgi:hypothetical protein